MSLHTLHIVHTNDIHSFFEQMPKVYTVIDHIRSGLDPSEVLVVDCGDHMDRMRVETEGTGGLANIEVMNQTGYELHVLGNNEGLTFPPEMIAKAYQEHAQFTVLGSNMYETRTGAIPGWMQPYTIIDKGPMKIGVIGVTIDFTAFYELLGWDIHNPFTVTGELVKQLRPQCDLIVIMSHLGLPHDRVMAETIDGIDIILGGHTHHLLEEPIILNGTCIAGAGKFGQYVGEVIVQYDSDSSRIARVDARCIPVEDYPADPGMLNVIHHFREVGVTNLNHTVAHLDAPLTINWETESPLGNLLAAGIRAWTGAQIALVNAGQILQTIQSGDVTKGQLLEICPSPINPCRMTLTGRQIKQALEEALLLDFIEKPIRGFGCRGLQLGTLCLDGLSVTYMEAAEPYHKIQSVLVGDVPLNLEAEYVVGTIDMFTFGIGYTSIQEGKDVTFYLPEFIRDVLEQQLQNPSAISSSKTRRWHPQ